MVVEKTPDIYIKCVPNVMRPDVRLKNIHMLTLKVNSIGVGRYFDATE